MCGNILRLLQKDNWNTNYSTSRYYKGKLFINKINCHKKKNILMVTTNLFTYNCTSPVPFLSLWDENNTNVQTIVTTSLASCRDSWTTQTNKPVSTVQDTRLPKTIFLTLLRCKTFYKVYISSDCSLVIGTSREQKQTNNLTQFLRQTRAQVTCYVSKQ